MKVKVSDIINAKESLKTLTDSELPPALAFKLGIYLIPILDRVFVNYEKVRINTIKEIGTKVEDDETKYYIPKEKEQEFISIMDVLMVEEVILDNFEKIPLSVFVKPVKPSDMYLLEWLIDEDK